MIKKTHLKDLTASFSLAVKLRQRWWWSCWGVTQKTTRRRHAWMLTGTQMSCCLMGRCADPQHIRTPVCLVLRCIVRALKDPNTFLMDHLLTLKPVRFLEGELIHDVSAELSSHSPVLLCCRLQSLPVDSLLPSLREAALSPSVRAMFHSL